MCVGMQWNHLPVAGGLYDQNPEILERFYYIMGEQAKWDKQQAEKREAERSRSSMKPTSRSGGRRGR